MDYSKITLGEMLSSNNQAIKRNATGILKQLQKCKHSNRNIFETITSETEIFVTDRCIDCGIVCDGFIKKRYSV